MATKQAYTVRNTIYNGTHGNLSIESGKMSKYVSADNDVLELFHLGVGVRMVQAKIFIPTAFTAGAFALKLVNAKDDTVLKTVIPAIDAKQTGVFDSDKSNFFPVLPDPQVETKLILVSTTGATGAKEIGFQIYTQSVGNS